MAYWKNTPKRGLFRRGSGFFLPPLPPQKQKKRKYSNTVWRHFFLFYILNIALFTTLVDNFIGNYIEVLSWRELTWAPGPVQSETRICNWIP